MFMTNDTYYKVFWLPHHGKVLSIFSKKINASFFRTGNCGGRKFIHMLTVQTTPIWCDAQRTLQCTWTALRYGVMPREHYSAHGPHFNMVWCPENTTVHMDRCVNLKSHTQNTRLLLQSPGFDSGPVHEKCDTGTGFYLGTLFYSVSIFPPLLHTHISCSWHFH